MRNSGYSPGGFSQDGPFTFKRVDPLRRDWKRFIAAPSLDQATANTYAEDASACDQNPPYIASSFLATYRVDSPRLSVERLGRRSATSENIVKPDMPATLGRIGHRRLLMS